MGNDIGFNCGERVKALRIGMRLSQGALAEAIGISQNHISQIERGVRGASRKLLTRLAEVLDTSVAYLLGETNDQKRYSPLTVIDETGNKPHPFWSKDSEEEDIPEPKRPPQILLPVIDQEACAGNGFSWDEVEAVAIDWMPFPRWELGGAVGPKSPYFVRVDGDSMIGADITDGCMVAVNPNIEVRNGDIAYVKWLGRCSIKGFIQRGDEIELRPANPNYKSTFIPKEEWEELEILGKVVRIMDVRMPRSIL